MAEHRTLTPAQALEQLRDARWIAPGLWIDRDGAAHVSVPALLVHLQMADTPANRALVTECVEEWFAENFPDKRPIHQDLES